MGLLIPSGHLILRITDTVKESAILSCWRFEEHSFKEHKTWIPALLRLCDFKTRLNTSFGFVLSCFFFTVPQLRHPWEMKRVFEAVYFKDITVSPSL